MGLKPDNRQYWYLFIGAAGEAGEPARGYPAGILRAASIGNNQNNLIKTDNFYFFSAKVAGTNYANLLEIDTKVGVPTWDKIPEQTLLLKYSVDGDRLTIWHMDWRAVDKEIAAGRLQGKIKEREVSLLFGLVKDKVRETQITESTEGLTRYLSHGGDKVLFPDMARIVFVRAK